MELSDGLHMLPVPIVRDGQTNSFNLSLLVDPERGATLFDTGLPGQQGAIGDLLAEAGLRVEDLRQIILTHQDIDHVGSLAALVAASGARVLAHRAEAPAIDGTTPPRFMAPEVLAQRPEMRALAEHFQFTRVDELLDDGQRLELGGGLRVVFTPGHVPGHTSYFHEPSGTLIAGDALAATDGVLRGPNPGASVDMAEASRSVARLVALAPRAVICYHGGLVTDDAAGQLRRVAAELSHLA